MYYVLDVVSRGQYGIRWLDHPRTPIGILLIAASVITVIAAVVFVARSRPAHTPEIIGLTITSGLLYLVPSLVDGGRPPRYTVAPVFLLVAALLATLDAALDGRGSRVVHRGHLAVIGITVVVLTLNVRISTPRSAGPDWTG